MHHFILTKCGYRAKYLVPVKVIPFDKGCLKNIAGTSCFYVFPCSMETKVAQIGLFAAEKTRPSKEMGEESQAQSRHKCAHSSAQVQSNLVILSWICLARITSVSERFKKYQFIVSLTTGAK